MITLNRERGFEKVESWDDVTSLPGFTAQLDPAENELTNIIGRYIFADPIPCGLTNCHQPHKKGYVVATSGGHVTNIGNVCGNNHFGVDFDQLSKAFDRALADHNNRENVGSFLFRYDRYKATIETYKQGDATWLHKTANKLTHRGYGCPDEIVWTIQDMVRRRDNTIQISRQASKDEIAEIEARERRTIDKDKPHYIVTDIGRLQGLEFLYKENNLRDMLIKDLEVNLSALNDLDVDSASSRELLWWSKWCSSFEDKLERIDNIINYGKALLTESNLRQLESLLETDDDKREYRSFLKQLLRGDGKI